MFNLQVSSPCPSSPNVIQAVNGVVSNLFRTPMPRCSTHYASGIQPSFRPNTARCVEFLMNGDHDVGAAHQSALDRPLWNPDARHAGPMRQTQVRP
jgi:hypothetical protein